MDMEETSDAKSRCPKKAFLSRARTSSTSISNYSTSSSTASLKDLGSTAGQSFSGLEMLANSSEILAAKRTREDSLTFMALPDDVKASFSKRSRDDSLSFASLPDEMKISFSELEETGLNIDDLNFTVPQSIEDAAPSNVTLDLTPKPDVLNDPESNLLPSSSITSSASSSNEYEIQNRFMHNVQSSGSYVHNNPTACDSSNVSASSSYVSINNPVTKTRSNSVSSNSVTCSDQYSGCSSSLQETKRKDSVGNQSAGTGIGSLLKESSNAIAGDTGYQRWETVTELPWADDRLVEEISQVSTTVGSSTEDTPKKKRRMSGVSKNKKMDNILCQVCGDLAAGFYCGAYICEACKKFYMRAYKQEKLKYVCLRDKHCVITKESRVQCQYCRYQKCLSLNMYCPKQGSEGDASKETQMSDIPCRVCSAPSSGFHFGAITCEGCKGFFRRMAKERELQRYQCTKDGNCEINMMTRNLCKACRYKACLKVGMSVEGSRIGRQPNSVKHEISLELKQGVKKEPGHKDRRKNDQVHIKEEPQEFFQGCSMSKTHKSPVWDGWGSRDIQPVLEHSVSIPGINAESVQQQRSSEEKSGSNISGEISSHNTSREKGNEHTGNKTFPKAAALEKPLTETASNNVPSKTISSPAITPEKTESENVRAELAPQKGILQESLSREIAVKTCSTEISSLAISESSYDVETDTSDNSDNEESVRQNEMMILINEVIDAARCLELVNYRVFDTDFIHNGKYAMEDVKKNFKNRFMDPKFQATVEDKYEIDMSIHATVEKSWASMMKSFTQHAYTAIRFAKSIPGFRSLLVHDQSRLLQSSIYPIILLMLSKVYDADTKTYNYFNYRKEEENAMFAMFPMLRVLGQHFEHVGEMVATLKITGVEFALLSAILLCPAEVKDLKEPQKVECLQNKLSSALQYYEENTYPDGAVRYGSLLVRIAELVQCMLQHNLAIGLLLTNHPQLKVPPLFDELIAESIK